METKKRKRTVRGIYERLALLKEAKGKCRYCRSLIRPDKRALEFDHIYPWSMGGEDNIDNLVVVCKSCNISKNAQTLEEYCGYLMTKDRLGRSMFNFTLWYEKNKIKRSIILEKLFWVSIVKSYDHNISLKEIKKLWN